jgi:hypothetical protein
MVALALSLARVHQEVALPLMDAWHVPLLRAAGYLSWADGRPSAAPSRMLPGLDGGSGRQ